MQRVTGGLEVERDKKMAERATRREMQKVRLLALILPQAERDELHRRYGPQARPALLSAIIGFFEFCLGMAVYWLGHPRIGGGFGLVLWHLNLLAWLGLLMMVTAIFRVANYFANQDSFGEPLVWLFLRLWQGKQNADARRTTRDTFGPERPDRVIVDEDGVLVLLASRAKPDWDDYRTVRIEDEFFKIEAVEERRAGAYMAVAYVLREVPESEVLRGIVHTDAKLPANAPPADAEAANPSDSS